MKFILIFLALAFTEYHCYSQSGKVDLLDKEHAKTVDSLTAHWNQDNKPGGAIAILQNGKVIYQNVLGYAEVTTARKITPQTPFQLAQLSDSFIAYALLKLAQDGKLTLDDKLHEHLPFVAHLGKQIIVKHLLEKSSGLHDFEILKNIVAWSDKAPFSIDDVERMIANQKEVSYKPGAEFSNSRTNMVLAAQIIAKVSGMDFENYMRIHIFVPLKMRNTFVLSKANQKSNDLASSYSVTENGSISPINSKKETYASINIASSIADLIQWELHLKSSESKDKALLEKFNEYVKLKNGKAYHIPMGKMTYGQKYYHKERGLETAMNTGGIDGFASAIFNFPDMDFTVIVLSNNGESYNGYIGMLAAHAIIEDAFTEPPSIDFNKINTVSLNPDYHKKFEGWYWDAEGELSRELRIERDTLRYMRSDTNGSPLIPLSPNRFQMKTDFDDKIFLSFEEESGKVSMQYAIGNATPFNFIKYAEKKYSEDELNRNFQGHYYCEALGIGYNFKTKNGKLIGTNIKTEDIIFSPVMDYIFAGNTWFLGSIEFQRNESNEVTGFYVRNDAIRNLWFRKLPRSNKI